MNPYVPLLFTLFVGVVGGFFDKTKKTVAKQSHENGIPPENALGGDEQELPSRESLFPKLTRAGVLLLILYVGSCCFSLYTAYQNVKDTDNKAQIAKQETTDAKNRAETLQVELQSAQDALSDLRKENLQQFKGVGEHLTQTASLVATRLDASSKELTSVIDQSGAELDLTTRGTSTLLNSFWLSVFEVSHHDDYELWAGHPEGVPITDEERRRFAEPFPELSSLACHAPVPMQIEVNIPLADEPIISLIAKTTMSNDTCHTTVHLEGGFDRGKQIATSQNWYGGPTPRSPKDLWPSSALFKNANLTDILDHYRVSTIAFRPTRGAFVHVASDNLDDLRELRSYAAAHLPLALGFHVRPSLDDGKIPLSEFAEERNFVLDTMYSNFSYIPSFGTGVTFLYQMAPMRPEWSSRGTTCPGVPAPRIALDNPYREGPAITDPCNPPLRKR